MPEKRAQLTIAEVLLLLLVLVPASLLLTAYLLDAAGWPIEPGVVGALSISMPAGALAVLWRARLLRDVRRDAGELAGFVLTVVGFFVFAMALAAPSFLPRTHSGDTVNHLVLIDFIRLHHTLPHDPRLRYYLGDMATYPPGSHVLGALVASWLGTPGVRVLHAVMAYSVAVNAALVYSMTVRLLPGARAAPVFGLTASLLLLSAFEYVIGPLLRWGFYSQVIAETFALATLWTLLLYDRVRARVFPVMFAVFGIATLLTWVGWLVVPLAAVTAYLALRAGIAAGGKIADWAIAVLPVVVVGLFDTLARRADSGMLTAEGSVLSPSVDAFGLPLLVLGCLGAVLAVRQARARPVLIFLGMVLAQAAVLWMIQTHLRVSSYYATFKTLYLLVYPLAALAALALATLWSRLECSWSRLQSPRSAWLTLALPVIVVGSMLWRKPRVDWPSAITQPVYESGLWARVNLPNGCVDYLLSKWPAHWVTVEWLQVNVLGNPVESERTRRAAQKFERRRTAQDPWEDPERLPYAIVGNWQELPRRVRERYTILYTSVDGTSAVVQRMGEVNQSCRDDTPTIDQLVMQPRTDTVASAVSRLMSNAR